MNLQKIEVIKSDERGVIYECGKYHFLDRKKGSMNANHTHEESETIYLVKGQVELTVGQETKIIEAPIKIEIAGDIFHKLIAITDIQLLYERYSE